MTHSHSTQNSATYAPINTLSLFSCMLIQMIFRIIITTYRNYLLVTLTWDHACASSYTKSLKESILIKKLLHPTFDNLVDNFAFQSPFL